MQDTQHRSPGEAAEAFHDFMDALSNHSDIPNPDDHRFVSHFPFMLAGAFDAKNVPVTKENVEKAFGMIDPNFRESFFRINPNYDKESAAAVKEASQIEVDEEMPEDKAKNEATLARLMKRLTEEGLFSDGSSKKEDPVRKVVVAALRSESRFAGIERDEDVIEHAQSIVENLARQQINAVNMPADHAFWAVGGLHILVSRYKENTVDAVLGMTQELKGHDAAPPALG